MTRRTLLPVLFAILTCTCPRAQPPARLNPGQATRGPAVAQQDAGPSAHQVLSASSLDGLTWTRDPGVRLEQASVPCALAEPDRVILYFVDGAIKPSTAACAISTDGLTFAKQPITIDGRTGAFAADPSIIRDTSGTYGLYYLAGKMATPPGPDSHPASDLHEIHLALGADPLHFKDTGVVLSHPGLVDPDVFGYKGTYYMYVFSNGQTLIATSLTGREFVIRGPFSPAGYGTVAPIQLPDGRLRLYAFNQNQRSGNRFVSFVSSDAIHWTPEPGVRLQASPSEMITDPFVVRWKGSYKMYFKVEPR